MSIQRLACVGTLLLTAFAPPFAMAQDAAAVNNGDTAIGNHGTTIQVSNSVMNQGGMSGQPPALRFGAGLNATLNRTQVQDGSQPSNASVAQVQPQGFNSSEPGANTTSSNSSATPDFVPASCPGGQNYTVVTNDTCVKIAARYGITAPAIIETNGLDDNCATLFPGMQLCLPQDCATYLVLDSDTCDSIHDKFSNVSVAQFESFNNLTVNSDCTNLIPGARYCISPPPAYSVKSTAITYASSSQPAPPNEAANSTHDCGMWYTAKVGDTGLEVTHNFTLPINIFGLMNPSVGPTVQLVAGAAYCVEPTTNWNSSTPIGAPAPVAQGAAGSCYNWHVVKDGDTCQSLEQGYSVSDQQLDTWNPSLNVSSAALQSGLAYCVNGTTPPPVAAPAGTQINTTAPYTPAKAQAFALAVSISTVVNNNNYYTTGPGGSSASGGGPSIGGGPSTGGGIPSGGNPTGGAGNSVSGNGGGQDGAGQGDAGQGGTGQGGAGQGGVAQNGGAVNSVNPPSGSGVQGAAGFSSGSGSGLSTGGQSGTMSAGNSGGVPTSSGNFTISIPGGSTYMCQPIPANNY